MPEPIEPLGYCAEEQDGDPVRIGAPNDARDMKSSLVGPDEFELQRTSHGPLVNGTTYTPFGAYGANTGEKNSKEAADQLMTDMRKDSKPRAEFLTSIVGISVSPTPSTREG